MNSSNTSKKQRRGWLRSTVAILGVGSLATACASGDAADADGGEYDDWPERPISIIVGVGAGGNTDLNSRALANGLSDELGVPVNVTNMEGGNTGIALEHILQQPADGHTLLGMAESIRGVCVLGYHESVVGEDEDWIPLVSVEFPGVLSVAADSPYEDMQDLLDEIEANPGSLQYSAADVGSVWNILGQYLQNDGGLEIENISYDGSAPSQNAVMRGEVDFVISSFGEQQALIEGDELRPLAAMTPESYEFEGSTVPSIVDFVPEIEEKLPFPGWQGIGIPAETPDEIVDRFYEAYSTVIASEDYIDFVDNLRGDITNYEIDESVQVVTEQAQALTQDLVDFGMASTGPEECGVTSP